MLCGPASAQDCLEKSKEPVDRGAELKVVFHYKIKSSQPTHLTHDVQPWHLPKEPPLAKDIIHSGGGSAFSPLHDEVSQKPAFLGSPPDFMQFFEGSLTHQQEINCVWRGPLVANC